MSKETKVVADIRAAIEACGMKDGMTISLVSKHCTPAARAAMIICPRAASISLPLG